MIDLLVIAKEPRAGISKTRLTPPFTHEQAAQLALAALEDTLAAVAVTPAARRVLVLDGEPGDWATGFEVVPQRGDRLAERLTAAFLDSYAGNPMFLVGMDTPQVTPSQLADSMIAMSGGRAVLGDSVDGGWWAIGLHQPNDEVFAGIPMSTPDTGRLQRERLASLGVEFTRLDVLRDIDTADDAYAIADAYPHLGFSRLLISMNGHRA